MLAVNAAGLKLIVVSVRRRSRDRVRRRVEVRRGDIVRQILVNSSRKKIRRVECRLANLPIHANSPLHIQRSVKVRVDAVQSRSGS